MSVLYPRPMGEVSRRLNGVMRQLEARQVAAREKAKMVEGSGEIEFAASLRGKAHGYGEALDLLRTLDAGRPLRRRHRWLGPAEPVREPSGESEGGQ